jgi:hypothetical protein
MSPAQAKAALRHTTVNTLYRKGNRGLYIFALLLVIASQPVAALNWGAYGAAMKNNTRQLPPAAKTQARYGLHCTQVGGKTEGERVARDAWLMLL